MLKYRLIMGSILVLVTTGVFYLDYAANTNWGFFGFITLVAIWALYEFYKMHESVCGHVHKILPFIFFAILMGSIQIQHVLPFGASYSLRMFLQYTLLGSLILLFIHPLVLPVFTGKYKEMQSSYVLLTSFIYIIIPVLIIYTLSRLNTEFWIIYLIAVNKIADSAAYFSGIFFGKHKLAPNISPNKTVEGFVGAVVFGIAVSWAMIYFFDMPFVYWQSLILGALISVFGQLGDLVESAIKRYCQVKDSGTLLPGLGGVLDLIDSILISAPVMFAALTVMIG